MCSGFLLFLFSGAVARSWACGSARLRARFGHIPSGELGPLLALGVKISAPAAGRRARAPAQSGDAAGPALALLEDGGRLPCPAPSGSTQGAGLHALRLQATFGAVLPRRSTPRELPEARRCS